MNDTAGNLLCVSNFRTNTGYAWDFIESLYAGVSRDLSRSGIRTWVAYPKILDAPRSLAGSPAVPIEMKVDFDSVRGLRRLLAFIRRHRIRCVYLTDRSPWHPAFVLLRAAGVRSIIVHDHTSGERTPPRGTKRWAKRVTRACRPATADLTIAVSRYVRARKIEVDLIPQEHVVVSYNSVDIPDFIDAERIRARFNVDPARPIIACACRAAEYKGVQHLLSAFDILCNEVASHPVLIYFGDGPYMSALARQRDNMTAGEHVIFAGYLPAVADLLAGADVVVVPSVWGEAFGLAALEPAVRGVPVVASAVGGLPEVVLDDTTGLLVPPADPRALSNAIASLLADPGKRARLGRAARERATTTFSRDRQLAHLNAIFRRQFDLDSSDTDHRSPRGGANV